MAQWGEFGRQVNRLVYALAGAKFQGDIESANRHLAEAVHYSEASIRAMRQGRFRPQSDQALETLAYLGQREADLPPTWALALLQSGRDTSPEDVVRRIYRVEISQSVTIDRRLQGQLPFYALRMVATLTGVLLLMAFWALVILPQYPPAHEITPGLEMLWGMLIGAGLALGLAAADHTWITIRKLSALRTWWPYLLPVAGGAAAGLIWHWVALALFRPDPTQPILSTALETLSYGFVYGSVFLLPVLALFPQQARGVANPSKLITLLLSILEVAGVVLFGYLLALGQGSFRNQQSVDMFVGLGLRFALALSFSVNFPQPEETHCPNVH